ncbi:hypothetical protein GGR58DRAFT_473097 [Xylaria digitata]|nr:hypothetical protein GGR58DRAFT_473097 [Xylaria digitata]
MLSHRRLPMTILVARRSCMALKYRKSMIGLYCRTYCMHAGGFPPVLRLVVFVAVQSHRMCAGNNQLTSVWTSSSACS